MKVEEIKLAFETNVQFTQLSDNAISSLMNFLSSDLQKAYDEKDLLIKALDTYNKKVDAVNSKFRSIEKGEYLKAYNDINVKAKELGIPHNNVKGLVELDKTYYRVKGFVSELTKL